MQNLTKEKWLQALVLFLACAWAGCSAEAKRERYMKRAETYFQSGEYIKAEIEYRNAARLSKTADPKLMARIATMYYDQGRAMEAFPILTNAVALNPDDAELRYKLGTLWITFRNYTNAHAAAAAILAKNPAHHDALLLLADAAQKPDEIAAAKRSIADIQRKIGDNWAVHIALAQLAIREQQIDVAEKETQLATQLAAKEPAVNVTRAQVASLRNRPQEIEQSLRLAGENSPARSPRKLLLAQYKMRGTNLTEAKALVDAFLKETPDYVPAWVLRGQIALVEKDYSECFRTAKTVLAWDPASYDIRLLNARALVLQQQLPKALEEFQRLESMAPGAPDLKYEMAVAYVQQGDVDEAVKKLDEALRLFPDYSEAILLRAELKRRGGETGEAVDSLVAFTRKYPTANRARLLLASAYSQEGKLDEALAIYREFIRSDPKVPEFRFFAGSILLQQKKQDEARLLFEETLNLSPAFLPAAEQIMDMDLAKKDYAAAQRRVDDQLRLTTNAPGAQMLQAKFCVTKRDWPCAEKALMSVIKAQPNTAAAYSVLANVYLSLGDTNKAIARLRDATEKNPKDAAAFMSLGLIYDALNDSAKAKKAYESTLELNPNNPTALNNLAYIFSEKLNQPDQALPHAIKADELAPNNSGVQDTLGWIWYRRGEVARALPLLRQSAGKLSDNAEAQYHFAVACYSSGDEATSRSTFDKVLRLDKNFSQADRIRRKLAVLDTNPASPKAADFLESIVKEDKDDFLATLKLGDAYERAGNYDKARSELEQAAKLTPTSPQPLIHLASLYANKLNDASKALEAGRAARKLAPNDPSIAGVLGRVSYRAHDYSGALVLLQEYSRSARADIDLPYDLALAYYGVGQFDEAGKTLRDYLIAARGSELAEAQSLASLFDFQMGKGAALNAQAIGLARLQHDAGDLPGLVALGLADQQNGKYSEAADKFEQAISLNKSFSLAQRQLAILYGEHLDKDAKALEYGQKARQAFPDDLQLARTLGKAAYRQKNFRGAIQLLAEAAKDRTPDAETFYFLGLAYSKANQPVEAKSALRKAIALNLPPTLSAEATQVLKSIP